MECRNVSQEDLEIIYQSALLQFRNGRPRGKIIVTLYGKGLEQDEAEIVADKAYRQYMQEEKQRELRENYDKPLITIPNALKTFGIKAFSFVLSMLFGHFINIERLMKRDEKRVK